MSQDTAEKIWSSILADKSFIAQVPEVRSREIFHEFIPQLLVALGDQLDALVTLPSIISAKIATVQCFLDTEFIEKLIPSYPKKYLQGNDVNELVAESVELFKTFISTLQGTLSRLDALFTNEATKTRALEHDFDLNAEMVALLKQGTLTIRALLEQQPMVLLKTSE